MTEVYDHAKEPELIASTVEKVLGELFCIGETVEYPHYSQWHTGVIHDIYRGPVTGWIVYDINGDGFYEHELRAVAS